MQHYSLLDLSPIVEGGTVGQALQNSVALAQHAERSGFHRYWLAEHHAMPGVASAATAVLIGHIAAHTGHMRIGAGGVMLPNHAPLVVAEQFGTLETLFPGRIDLGLGRAPGSDGPTARALRRYFESADRFPQDVAELLGYLGDEATRDGVQAIPGQGTHVPVWILGSSLFGAQLAAQMGLPYAFASHFAPDMLDEALRIYRAAFTPSAYLDRPHAMIVANVHAADSDEEAAFLRSSQVLAFASLRQGNPSRLPHPVRDAAAHVSAPMLRAVDQALSVSATGTPDGVRAQLARIIERYQPDELMVAGMIHDAEAARRSLGHAAEALQSIIAERRAA